MYDYIVCTCGRSIGDITDLFYELRSQEYMKIHGTSNIDPSMIAINEQADVRLGKILDSLYITLACCRLRLLTQIQIKTQM